MNKPNHQLIETNHPSERAPTSYLLIWVFACLLLVSSWSAIFYKINVERQAEVAQVYRNNANLARAFEEHTIRTVQSVDQAILFLRNQYERVGDKIDIAGYVRDGLINTDVFTQLGIINEKGIYSHGSQNTGIGTDISDREHFRAHVAADTGQLFIGQSQIGRISQKWSMTFTRRITKRDGSFGGVVAVSLDPQYLTSFYRQIDLGKYGIVTLVGADSMIRARRQGEEVSYGQDLTGSAVIKAAFEQVNGTTVNVARVDGIKRLYSFRKVRDYPLWVFVASGEGEALAETSRRAQLYLLFGGILSLLIIGFSLAITRDITKRRHTELKLANSEMQLRTVIENEPECVKVLAPDGSLLQMNRAGLDMIEADSIDQVRGHHVTTIVSPEHRAAFSDLNARVNRGESGILEFEIVGLKGGHRWLETHAVPLRDGKGGILGLLGVTRDITEKKAAIEELERHRHHLEQLVAERTHELVVAKEAAEAANIAKSNFLTNMSHELRTPMNGVLGMAHLIRRGGVTPKQAEQLDKLHIAGNHLVEIINAILDLTKIEAGKVSLEAIEVDLNSITTDIVSMLVPAAELKHLQLSIENPPQPYQLIGDPTRLKQALLNYASNAVKFTEQGRVTLRSFVEEETATDVLVRFEVEDTGVGIDPDAARKLFHAFEQADSSTTRKYGGTGLGLIITKKLAELMGGTAGVRSTLNVGSTFWFTAKLRKR